MIKARFFTEDNLICGYEISGHSGSAEAGQDIICAFVSSAAYMAANTLSEIVGAEIEAEVADGYMNIRVVSELSEAQQILEGLRLHLRSLAGDYPDNIKVI
ncbi:MAG: ribosomal-processing cysteine protease Prp [Clostridia bacterium]|nr:ribosomal-processing cysteine protease Prp [Clostridia bacterium]